MVQIKCSSQRNTLTGRISRILLAFGCFLAVTLSFQVASFSMATSALAAPIGNAQLATSGIGNQIEGQAKKIQGEVQKNLGNATNQADGFGKQVQGKVKQDLGTAQRSAGNAASQAQGATRQAQGKVQSDVGRTQDAVDKAGDRIEDTNRGVVDAVKDFFGK